MKSCVLFDHDGVLVDTEPWYFRAGERALAEIGFEIDLEDYLEDMRHGRGTWARARAAGVDEPTIDRARRSRDAYYQKFLRHEDIDVAGVLETLRELSGSVRMAIVTTSKRVDFDLIHQGRQILPLMEFVLLRDDYAKAKPHPEPYLTGLARFGVPAGQALVVEDSARGLASAVAAGIDCCVVNHHFTASHDLSDAAYRVDTIGELPALLASIK